MWSITNLSRGKQNSVMSKPHGPQLFSQPSPHPERSAFQSPAPPPPLCSVTVMWFEQRVQLVILLVLTLASAASKMMLSPSFYFSVCFNFLILGIAGRLCEWRDGARWSRLGESKLRCGRVGGWVRFTKAEVLNRVRRFRLAQGEDRVLAPRGGSGSAAALVFSSRSQALQDKWRWWRSDESRQVKVTFCLYVCIMFVFIFLSLHKLLKPRLGFVYRF